MKATPGVLPVISPNNKAALLKSFSTKERLKFPPITDTTCFEMKSLDRHIRNNDVTQILKDARTPQIYERGVDDITKEEVKETSANLLYLRKKYDELRESCNTKEQEINKLRMEAEKLKAKETQFSEDSNDSHNKLLQLKNALEIQKNKIEEALENNRVYIHMLDRLKRDKLTDKMKATNLEARLHNDLGGLNVETRNAKQAAQFEIQTKSVFEGVMRQIEQEDKKRQQSLFLFEKTLNAQEEADQKRTERMMRNQVVAETALNDLKDSNENQWRELQLVHKFINFFLKRKIEREIRHYEAVEKAYQKIKASTGLSDTREIVSKFVNREQTYSELLISIADYEKKISELRKINEQRNATIQALKEKSLPPEKPKDEKTNAKPSLLESYKDLESVSNVSKQAKLVVEKTYSWVMQTLIKIDKAKKVFNNKYYDQYPKENVSGAFIKVIETVKSDLTAIQEKEKEVEKVLDEIDKTRVDEVVKNEDFISKNVRVKPINIKPERLKTIESPLNSKKSFHAEDPENVEAEPEENADEEHESLEPYRLQIKHKALQETTKSKREKKEKEEKNCSRRGFVSSE